MRYLLLVLFAFSALFLTKCSEEPKQSIKEDRPSAKTPSNGVDPLEREEIKMTSFVQLSTEFGDVEIGLYDNTPKHRDNFIKLTKEGFYDDLLFHRVISDFMIQGGDPNSKGADAGAKLGNGGPGYTVPAEFNPSLVHKKGALAAARTGGPSNPGKESSGSQFYIVQGKVLTDNDLAKMEQNIQQVMPGFQYSEEQKKIYKTIGGTAFLDMNYTVYGEVTEGLDVIDKIAAVETAPGDRPVNDVKMTVRIVEK